jgi:UrcA family protein
MNKTALALAVAIAATGAAAHAQPVDEAPSIGVSFADLDLGQAAGRATLEARVTRAVWRLCPTPYVGDIQAMDRYRGCRKAAWSGVRPQLASIYARNLYAGVPGLALAAK